MELARNLKIDSVSRLQPTRPLIIESTAPVEKGLALMRQHRVGCLLVCDVGRKLIGVFTERDWLQRVIAPGKPWSTAIGEVMTPDPACVGSKDPIRSAIRQMEKGGYRHLPVIDETGRPVGILSVRRIVHFVVEHFPATVYNLPPDPRDWPMHREGA